MAPGKISTASTASSVSARPLTTPAAGPATTTNNRVLTRGTAAGAAKSELHYYYCQIMLFIFIISSFICTKLYCLSHFTGCH